MSEMEYNKGTAILSSEEEVLAKYPDAWLDDLEWDTKGEFCNIDGKIYKIEWDVRKGEWAKINNLDVNEDFSMLKFEIFHHNGSAHWTEMVEKKIKELKGGK